MTKKALGKGLSALLGENEKEASANGPEKGLKNLPITAIYPNPSQPRTYFNQEALQELAESITTDGLIQPIIVRTDPQHSGRYIIVAGERRWRAAQIARLDTLPALVTDASEPVAVRLALIENIQRENLTPLEEAEGYKYLIVKFGYHADTLGKSIGKSRSHIANMLRLLSLPPEIKAYLEGGMLTAGHARALINAVDSVKLAHYVVENKLSVRETEQLVAAEKIPEAPHTAEETTQEQPSSSHSKASRTNAQKGQNSELTSIASSLSEKLHTSVAIFGTEQGGTIRIHYKNMEDLNKLLELLY